MIETLIENVKWKFQNIQLTQEQDKRMLDNMKKLDIVQLRIKLTKEEVKLRLSEAKEKVRIIENEINNIPVFDGNSNGYVIFKKIFETRVLKNNKITNAEKVDLLMNSLNGYPRNIAMIYLQQIENIQEVWEKLKANFDDKNFVIRQLRKN